MSVGHVFFCVIIVAVCIFGPSFAILDGIKPWLLGRLSFCPAGQLCDRPAKCVVHAREMFFSHGVVPSHELLMRTALGGRSCAFKGVCCHHWHGSSSSGRSHGRYRVFPPLPKPMKMIMTTLAPITPISTTEISSTSVSTISPSTPTTEAPSSTSPTLPNTSPTPTPTPKVPNTTTTMPRRTRSNNNRHLMNHINFDLLAGPHCGFGLSARVSMGEEVTPGELPWIVMLRYREFGLLVFRCGGALISPRYVLTAAHCIVDNKGFNLTSVWLGETDLGSTMDCLDLSGDDEVDSLPICRPPQEIRVAEAIPHPKFRPHLILQGLPHDIGIIRMKKDAQLSPFVMPICLGGLANLEISEFRNVDTERLTVAGWGMTDTSEEPRSEKLRRVNVTVVPHAVCEARTSRNVSDTCQICAGGGSGNVCPGDSGGPLVAQAWRKDDFNRGLSRALLLGVVSSGSSRCGVEAPSVFTNVDCYLEWILDTVKP